MVWVKVPETPWTVIVKNPVLALLAAVSVSTLVVLVEVGANAAVTPVPIPEADSVTLPVKPFVE